MYRSNEAPSPERCARPAPPLNLSVLIMDKRDSSQPPPFSLMGAGTPALRKIVPKPLFELFDEKVYLIRLPTLFMRLIDSLRYHKPTPEERVQLNLCSSTERLYLHTLNDLLLACGGRKGFRFTSVHINRLRHHCDDISAKYDALDQAFKTMPLEVTQYKFPPNIQRIEDEPSEMQHQESSNNATGGCGSPSPAQVATTQRMTKDDEIRYRACGFQRLARDYVNSYARLRDTCVEIRVCFQHYLENDLGSKDRIEIRPEPVEAEFEAKAHQPFPAFLDVLIQKYHREQRNQPTEWTSSSAEPPVDSIGVFSVYLSYVLLHQVSMTHHELHSFEILLQILKLSYRVEPTQLKIVEIVHPEQPTHSKRLNGRDTTTSSSSSGNQYPVTHITLCTMLYEFLATVRELRLVSKQKNLLPKCKRRRE